MLNPIRWWPLRSCRRNPLARRVDRIEALMALLGAILVVVAAFQVIGFGQSVYTDHVRLAAEQSTTHHRAEATAIGPSTSIGQVHGSNYTVPVQWFANNATHEETIRVARPLKSGEKTSIWIDNSGNQTPAPINEADAGSSAISAASILWLLIASAVLGSLCLVRYTLNRVRYREWDDDLHRLLVDNDGGWASKDA